MDAIAREEHQARRDVQIRKMVLGLLDSRAGERERSILPREFIWSLLVFMALFWLVVSISDVGTFISLLQGQHVHVNTDSLGMQLPLFGAAWMVGQFVLFPRRYLYAGADALLRAAADGDSRFAPRVEPELASTSTITLPADGEELGPFLRWTGKNMADSRSNGGCALVGLGFVLAGFGVFMGVLGIVLVLTSPTGSQDQPSAVLGLIFFIGIGLLLIGMGVWPGLAGRRVLREAGWMRRDLAVLANPDGLTWSDRAWRGREHMRMSWRDIRSFCVVTYRPPLYDEEYRIYILDGGQTRLLWALPARPSDERLAAHSRLSALVSANSSAPLRDLTPGIIALGAALRSADSLRRSAEESAYASAQPAIPGVPVDAMRRWYRRFLTIMITTGALSLIIGIADTIARLIS